VNAESHRPRAGAIRLGRQRRAVSALRRALEREDGSLGHPYFRDLGRCSRRTATPVSGNDFLRACGRSTVVYLGDFHADPACQEFASDLLGSLAVRGSGLGLGVEFVHTLQQRALDLRQAGRLDDESFLRRIRYAEEWGFAWSGYRALLDRARALGVPVFALDRSPRGGAAQLAARDDHAARQIVRILTEGGASRLLVFFGESHVTPLRLPRRVEKAWSRTGIAGPVITVLQDPEGAYWKALEAGSPPPRFGDLGEGCLAVFHTAPLERYERYRQVLDRWRGETIGELDSDLTPAVHHLIDLLARWLRVRPERRKIRHGGGWSEPLRDSYPEVYSGPDAAELLATILREHGRSPEEVGEAAARFRERGALYEPRSNAFFLERFLPGPAAGEAARFLRAALGGRLFRLAEDPVGGDPAERAYGHAYNEALAFLGARWVDPVSVPEAAVETKGTPDAPTVRFRLEWMERHREFEASGKPRPPRSLLEPLRRSRAARRALARDLGHRLGSELYARVHAGALESRELRALFTRVLDPPHARRRLIELLRAT
jgi:hypothetical protein